MRNAHFPKVEASNKQVETQNGGNLTNINKSTTTTTTTTTRNQKVMGKDRKKEAERQRKIRLNKKTGTKMLEAFWAYAEKKNPALRNEFLASYEGEQSSNQEARQEAQQEQETPQQETPQQETPQQSLELPSVNYPDLGLHFLNYPNSLDFIDNMNLDFFNF
jgi:hypothetical protein